MIIIGMPKNKDNYLCVKGEVSTILHANGFMPKYINSNNIWYEKNKDIMEFMEVNKLEWK